MLSKSKEIVKYGSLLLCLRLLAQPPASQAGALQASMFYREGAMNADRHLNSIGASLNGHSNDRQTGERLIDRETLRRRRKLHMILQRLLRCAVGSEWHMEGGKPKPKPNRVRSSKSSTMRSEPFRYFLVIAYCFTCQLCCRC